MFALALAAVLGAAPTELTIDVKPETTIVKVDGKKVGTGAKTINLKLPPGKHAIRCEYKGDSHSDEVVLKAGKKTPWSFEFTGEEKSPQTTEPVVPEGGEAPK